MGAGPIGLATLTWAKGKGATVVVSEMAAGRIELARKLGADVVVNPQERRPRRSGARDDRARRPN